MAEEQENPASQLPLYLKQVRIRNYAPLLDATADFQRGLNIIIGPNGVGKTRFLERASMLISPFDTLTTGVNSELILGYDQDVKVYFQESNNIENKSILSHAQFLPSSELNGKNEVKVLYKNKEGIGQDLDLALFRAGIDAVFGLVLEPILSKHGTPIQHAAIVDVAATLIFRISVGRVVFTPEIKFTAFPNQQQFPVNLFNTIGFLFARINRYQRINNLPLTLSIDDARNEIERIISAFINFLNPYLKHYSSISQVRFSNAYQVYDDTAQQEIIVKGLVLEYLIGKSWLPFSALSDGTKRIFYLITQLVMPTARFDEQQAPPFSFNLSIPPRIIFLEEPELGIHHSQLHKLLQLIREVSGDSQIIMTTHAPQVLDMLTADELDRITVCSLDPQKATQFHKLSEEKQKQARTYMKEVGFLSDYWRYSYLEEAEA